MKGVKSMGIVELRPVLGERVDAAHYMKEPTVITKKGKPRAALVPYEWLEQLLAMQGGSAAVTASVDD